jgi:hypothetical protein
MNADQKRTFDAQLARHRQRATNDNASPDYRQVGLYADRVSLTRRAWLNAVKSLEPEAELESLREAYHMALVAYHTASEIYWGREVR